MREGEAGEREKGEEMTIHPRRGMGLFLKQKLVVEPERWAESDEGDYGSITEAVFSVPEVCFQERKRYSWTYSDFDV